MTSLTRPSLRDAIDAKCKSCIYDPGSRGKWREQVAACVSANCSLFDVRPVPRDCVKGGVIDPAAIVASRSKTDHRDGRP